MESLKDHAAVAEMLHLMEESGRREEAKEFSRLIAAVDSFGQQYDGLLEELQEMKRQLAEATKERHPVREALSQAAQVLERGADDLHIWLSSLRKRIISCAETVVADFKREGVSALDKVVSALNIQTHLESMRAKIAVSVNSVEASIGKIESVGKELRSAGGHLKNAGRAASGKDIQQIDGGEEGRFQRAALTPLRAASSALDRADRTICAAQDAVDRLGHAAERNHGKRERTSVRQRLEAESSARAVPSRALSEPVKRPREAER